MATVEELQARLDTLLSHRESSTPPSFSAFRVDDLTRAHELTAYWAALPDLEGALVAAEGAMATADPELVGYALLSFLTHTAAGGVRIPPLAVRSPYKVVPSLSATATAAAQRAVFEANPETQLAWWREDPGLNEFYEQWRVIYDPVGERKDRHGELFLYLHRQLLARYETERMALRLEPVRAWWPYTIAADPSGYNPGPGLASYYRTRGPNKKWADAPALATQRQGLWDRIERGEFADANALGNEVQAWSDASAAVFAAMGTPAELRGVADDPATTARDHLFWRWHKSVDDLYAQWQSRQPAHDFADAPPVTIRKQIVAPFAAPGAANVPHRSPDIILSRISQIPEDWRNHLPEFGQAVFGGEQWDEEFSSTSYTTTELHTTMRGNALDRAALDRAVLDREEFAYFLRLDNRTAEPAGVTVRVLLVPQELTDERRMWMEMDKFRCVLKRGERAVICRPASLSAVVRKAGAAPAGPGDADYDCGWPSNLLLPRGRTDGMRFRLLVLLTDWTIDKLAPDSPRGSFSFCGARDRYPDTRPMGYPFDRPLPDDKTISQFVTSQPWMATRDFTIRWFVPDED